MIKFIPVDKRSKKEQKKFNSLKRKNFGILNPATRVIPNKKRKYVCKEDFLE